MSKIVDFFCKLYVVVFCLMAIIIELWPVWLVIALIKFIFWS